MGIPDRAGIFLFYCCANLLNTPGDGDCFDVSRGKVSTGRSKVSNLPRANERIPEESGRPYACRADVQETKASDFTYSVFVTYTTRRRFLRAMEVSMAIGSREQPTDASKYEKSFDNCCAALVSREGRAPRAGQDCKPLRVNGLRLMSLLIMARGAHVSRAARGLNAH